MTVNGAGAVTDWGITNPMTNVANNTSPVNYPGVGLVPSPGGSKGEVFDLEGLYSRVQGGNLQVLLVSSNAPIAYSSDWDRHYRLGDVFIDTNLDGTYDYAAVTTGTSATAPGRSIPAAPTPRSRTTRRPARCSSSPAPAAWWA